MLLTQVQQQLPVIYDISYEFFIFQQNNVSAQWACAASVSVSPISYSEMGFFLLTHALRKFNNNFIISYSEMGDILVYFYQTCGSDTQIWTKWTIKLT